MAKITANVWQTKALKKIEQINIINQNITII